MGDIYISLFNRFLVTRDGQPLRVEGNKVQELFGYLSLFYGKVHSRDVLADQLWYEGAAIQSRRYLSKTLWQLQNSVAEPAILSIESDWIQLNPNANILIDTALFEQAYKSTQKVPGRALTPSQFNDLRTAVELYTGDLLVGWYQQWCMLERHRFQFLYLAIVDKLIDYCEAHQAYEVGIEHGLRLLHHEPTREKTHQQIMRLLYLAGDRSGAMEQFVQCKEALKRELEVVPDAQTIDLYERIKANALIWPQTPETSPSTISLAQAPSAEWSDLLDHLLSLHANLSLAQRQVEQDIQWLTRFGATKP